MLEDLQQVPTLSIDQLYQSMLAISNACWRLKWMTRHDQGQSTFTWTYLDWKKRVYFALGTNSIKPSQILKVVHASNGNVEIAASLGPVINRFARLSDIIALRTEDIKIMAPRRPFKVRPRIIVSLVKLKFELSLEKLDLHLLLNKEKTRGGRYATKFTCLNIQLLSRSLNQAATRRIQSCFSFKSFVFILFVPFLYQAARPPTTIGNKIKRAVVMKGDES